MARSWAWFRIAKKKGGRHASLDPQDQMGRINRSPMPGTFYCRYHLGYHIKLAPTTRAHAQNSPQPSGLRLVRGAFYFRPKTEPKQTLPLTATLVSWMKL